MPRITITISDELDEFLDKEIEESDRFNSKAEVMRHYLDRGREADSLEQELEITEKRLEELRQQLYHQDSVEEKVDVLATRVEKAQQQQNAPFVVRWWNWWKQRGTIQ